MENKKLALCLSQKSYVLKYKPNNSITLISIKTFMCLR